MKATTKAVQLLEAICSEGLDNTQWTTFRLYGDTHSDILSQAREQVVSWDDYKSSLTTGNWPARGKWVAVWFDEYMDHDAFPEAEIIFETTHGHEIRVYLVADLNDGED